jgi:iron complex outermembrane receptor protein
MQQNGPFTRSDFMHAFRSFRLLPVLSGLCALVPLSAYGQSVDYGTLEQMYGEPVTTSATGKPQLASTVPADMVIISQDDIRRSGADNIPDILQFVTGIDVRHYSFGDAQVGIRGYDTPVNPRLLVLVDGRQVYLDYYGYTAWNTIPVQLDEIRQIEIVKGPASALFGFNAASGVINIITFDPLLDKVNTATVRGGTQGYGGGDAVVTQHIGTTAGVRISVGGWTATGFETQAGGSDPVPPRYGSVNMSSRWQIAPGLLLRAEGGITDAHSLTQTPNYGGASDFANNMNFWRVGAAAETRAGAFDLDIYRNQSINNTGLGGPYNNTNDTLVAKLTDLLKVNANNTIRVGLEYRHNGIQYSAANSGTDSYDNYAINGMWDWQIAPAFDLTNAVRVDHLGLQDTGVFVPTPGRTRAIYDSTTLTEPSFNSGLVITVSDQDTVRLLAARGLQIPSLLNYTQQASFPGALAVGTPALAPTAVWNAELAYDRKLGQIGATLTTSAFFQRNTSLIGNGGNNGLIFFQNGTPYVAPTNIGSSNEVGFEIGLSGKTQGGLKWNASYRYASITDDITAAAAAIPSVQSRYASGTPAHAVVFGLGYSLQKWEFDAQGLWQSSYTDVTLGRFGPQPVIIGNYVTFNARIGYRVTDYLTLAGTAQQLNASQLRESGGDYVDRRFIASANVHF